MTGMSPEQEALLALNRNLPRSNLSMAAQLEYDRLRAAREWGEAADWIPQPYLEAGAPPKRHSWLASWRRSHASAEQHPSEPSPGPDIDVDSVILGKRAGGKFSTTRLRPGYDLDEVDAFLEEIRETFLGIRDSFLTSDDVRKKQFSTTRLRPGYDQDEVDALLDEVELRLAASRPGRPRDNEPELNAYGLPVQDRLPTGRTYWLSLASLICGIVSAGLAITDVVAYRILAGYLVALGMLSSGLAVVLHEIAEKGMTKYRRKDKQIKVVRRIASAGLLLGVFGFFFLMIGSGHGDALNNTP